MSAVLNDRDAILQAAATRIVNPKNADILLQQSAPAFHVNAAGAADVASITVTGTLVGLEGALSWSVQGATLTNVTEREATVAYANMQGTTAIVTASIMSSGERFAKSVVLATMQDGAPGSSAKTVKLTPSEQVFKISKAGANSPASITLTATGQNTAGTPSFTIPVGTATLSAGSSAGQKVLSFANMTTDQVTVEVTLDGQKDRVTIYKVREGQDGQDGDDGLPGVDAIVGLLTNEAVTLPAGSNGSVSSFSGAVCTMKVYQGVADDSANWAYAFSPASASNRLSYTASGATLTVTGMATGVDSAYVDITATKTGAASITKRFTVTKSKAGANGTGTRGPGQHYAIGSTWSDVAAQAACPGGPVVNDQVTISNGTVTYTKRWDGSAWNVPGAYLSGDMFVEGGIHGSRLKVGTVEVVTPDGTPVVTINGLQPGFEAPGTKNSDLDTKFAALDAPLARWDFTSGLDSWTGSTVATVDATSVPGSVIWTPTATNPYFSRNLAPAERFIGSDAPRVRARIRRVSGTGTWEGNMYYSTAGHNASGSYYKRADQPANPGAWNILEWDMSQLDAGGSDWLNNSITSLRIDLVSSNSPASAWEIDWVAVGKFNSSVSPAQLQAIEATANAASAGLAGKLNTTGNQNLEGPIAITANGAIVVGSTTTGVVTNTSGITLRKNGKNRVVLGNDGEFGFFAEDGSLILGGSSSLAQQAASNPNLAPNCRGFTMYSGASANRNGDPRFGDGQYIWIPVTATTVYVGAESPPLTIPAGAPYTVSFDAYCNGAGSGRVLNVDVYGEPADGADWIDTAGIGVVPTPTQTRYKFTATMPNQANAPRARLRIFAPDPGGREIIVANIKVELGTKETPWGDSVITGDNAKSRVFIQNLQALAAFMGNIEIGAGGAVRQGQTGYDVGQGFFLGAGPDGSAKMSMAAGTSKVLLDPANGVLKLINPQTQNSFSASLTNTVMNNQVNTQNYQSYSKNPTLSNGTPAYRYSWNFTVEQGDIYMASSPSDATLVLKARGWNAVCSGFVSLTVVDQNGATDYASCRVSIQFGSGVAV